AIVTVEEAAAFVIVAVAAEHEIDAVALQDTDEILTDMHQLGLLVAVVGTHRKRRMVPVGDDPSPTPAAISFEVLFYPLHLWAEGIIETIFLLLLAVGVQREEMGIAEVIRIKGLGIRWNATGLAVLGNGEVLVIGDAVRLLRERGGEFL